MGNILPFAHDSQSIIRMLVAVLRPECGRVSPRGPASCFRPRLGRGNASACSRCRWRKRLRTLDVLYIEKRAARRVQTRPQVHPYVAGKPTTGGRSKGGQKCLMSITQ